MITEVELSGRAKKDLMKVPKYIVVKLKSWIMDVQNRGLEEVRKIPGFHDEGLKGHRQGQRSIRLSKTYRAIYVIKLDAAIEFVFIEEVNKHEY